MKSRIELKNMEFFAHHGCFGEERLIGNKFLVNLSVVADSSAAAETDDINDAVNYQILYDIVANEMAIPSHLLEHVANRILESVRRAFPQISYAEISIDKLNPPLGGKVGSSRVVMAI